MQNKDVSAKDASTYERILKAAAKLFAEKGYSGTTTREIVKEAGSSLSSLQFYFQSKESVYSEAINRALARQHEMLKPIFDEINAYEQAGLLNSANAWNLIIDLVTKMTDWVMLKEEQDVIRLMNQEMTSAAPLPLFSTVPVPAMDVHGYFYKLFLSYATNMDSFSAKLLSFFVVISFFNLALYPRVLGQILECDMDNPENILHAKILTKSYILTSIQAYLNNYRSDNNSQQETSKPVS